MKELTQNISVAPDAAINATLVTTQGANANAASVAVANKACTSGSHDCTVLQTGTNCSNFANTTTTSENLRAVLYDVLRRFFYVEPCRDLLTACRSNKLFVQLAEANNFMISHGAQLIESYFASNNPLKNDDDLKRLRWDFTQLFIGLNSPAAPPWASFYLEKDRLLFSNTTLFIRTLLNKYGFIAGERINAQADDHIGIELDFLYQTSKRHISELDIALLKDQAELIGKHMLHFVPQFKNLVEKNAITEFFSGAANILEGYLAVDHEVINNELKMRGDIA
ncbi:MAG: molecular chaperone TorD family protein [Coriobacteriales bacterium]|jgi:TorA maturation chaperone TorD|nr:molecular chaperone TorD family protein [Coriobacteriales bacterium]